MIKHYTKLLDQLDSLMLALSKQKKLGLDVDVLVALKDLNRARNTFKHELFKSVKPVVPTVTIFNHFLDIVSDNVIN